MNKNIELFIKQFTKEVKEENVAIFAGAGLSIPAGFVNWKELLRPIADSLGLEISKETDLVSIAQYYCNENSGNRNKINQLIFSQFNQKTNLTENHKILARLPINTYWTINYDKLIETSLEVENKNPDVKYTVNQLAVTKPKRKAIVYKMHGDVEHPHDAVIIKDDYENYHSKMSAFVTALSGDLVSKTFLFIGISFTDPNLDYIFSRIRSTYNNHQREHFCFIKKEEISTGELQVDFEYRCRRQELFINDLKRVNIKTLLLDSYEEITTILKAIENNLKRETIFISGSAATYAPREEEKSEIFLHELSKRLIVDKQNIVSGFGLGVGSYIISGALEEMYLNQGSMNDEERLILRPFPQKVLGHTPRAEVWHKYRSDMISRSGISLFLFGNKVFEDKIIKAGGMTEEFDISKELGNFLIPVGATGYEAKNLWIRINSDFESYYPKANDVIVDSFAKLNDDTLDYSELINEILIFIKAVQEYYYK